ncbi:hypothetical protein F4806DRAFT_477157 [Annulohypoxylon nitens]|nr:hypothetical protein F4806DRAFT_477157 [Annulohypoxylon nitens]
MSSRITKRAYHSGSSKRSVVLNYLSSEGSEHPGDVMPCTRCVSKGIPCRMAEGASRCAGCIVAKHPSCDGEFVGQHLSSVMSARQKIELEEQDAEASLALAQQQALVAHEQALVAHSKATEALGRLTRLRKQREALVAKGKTQFVRGSLSLDEKDENQEAEDASSADKNDSSNESDGQSLIDRIPWDIVGVDFNTPLSAIGLDNFSFSLGPAGTSQHCSDEKPGSPPESSLNG